MNKIKRIAEIRRLLNTGNPVVGSWMQIDSASIAEIMGDANYDWVAIDLEHGSFNDSNIQNIFRALELNNTLPLARIISLNEENCKKALDNGACGLIIPKIENAIQAKRAVEFSSWPPKGRRGVGYSRANLFGKRFELYKNESQKPLLVGMIESREGIENLDEILKSKCFDAIMIGPYDLSASLGLTGKLDNRKVIDSIKKIKLICKNNRTPCGIHIVEPDPIALSKSIKDGHLFIAYAGDSMFLNAFTKNPYKKK
jgi:2-dehydro-3-deoxyglucarate aldolase|tara:strand:- start:3725 stop:4492 length:768 start_codon:yes stop_codon:yes gene_type:complete